MLNELLTEFAADGVNFQVPDRQVQVDDPGEELTDNNIEDLLHSYDNDRVSIKQMQGLAEIIPRPRQLRADRSSVLITEDSELLRHFFHHLETLVNNQNATQPCTSQTLLQ